VPEERHRLDLELEQRGLARSRSQARDLIRRGLVRVDGKVATKPGMAVALRSELSVDAAAAGRVSRGGDKLVHALDRFALSPAARVALDLGASTGGFTRVLLERGAARVYAVDVGHGQLVERLRHDPRVVVLEGTDARALDDHLIDETVGAITADLSFISLTRALGPALALAGKDAWLVALVKPQFEAGREHVGKRGLVRARAAREAAVKSVSAFLESRGWRVTGATVSPIAGKGGNEEWLLAALRQGGS